MSCAAIFSQEDFPVVGLVSWRFSKLSAWVSFSQKDHWVMGGRFNEKFSRPVPERASLMIGACFISTTRYLKLDIQ